MLVLLPSAGLAQDALSGGGGASVAAAPKLTDVQELKKQTFLLRVEVAQLKARLADRDLRVQSLETVVRLQIEGKFQEDSKNLSTQCKALEAEFREALKIGAAKVFDCQTLEFK